MSFLAYRVLIAFLVRKSSRVIPGVVGIGLDARLTTEIIVAKLLLDPKLINVELFTALVAAASFTALTVPLAFTLLVRQWADQIRVPKNPFPENPDICIT